VPDGTACDNGIMWVARVGIASLVIGAISACARPAPAPQPVAPEPVAVPMPEVARPELVPIEQGPGTITGRVVLGGRPVTHFYVWRERNGQIEVDEVRSGSGGFRFTLPTSGAYRVVMFGPGFVRHEQQVSLSARHAVDLGDVPVEPGFVIDGRVIAFGAPIRNARVRINTMDLEPRLSTVDLAAGVFEATTDATGWFRIPGVWAESSKQTLCVTATAPGKLFGAREISVASQTLSLDLQIAETGSLRIRADGWDGLVIARLAGAPACKVVARGRAGHFKLDNVPAGEYELELLPGSEQTWRVRVESAKLTEVQLSPPASPRRGRS
jgi:hypothetical protein